MAHSNTRILNLREQARMGALVMLLALVAVPAAFAQQAPALDGAPLRFEENAAAEQTTAPRAVLKTRLLRARLLHASVDARDAAGRWANGTAYGVTVPANESAEGSKTWWYVAGGAAALALGITAAVLLGGGGGSGGEGGGIPRPPDRP